MGKVNTRKGDSHAVSKLLEKHLQFFSLSQVKTAIPINSLVQTTKMEEAKKGSITDRVHDIKCN